MRVGSTTWAGGELSPDLHGRVDLNKYQTGLAAAINLILSVEGGVRKRPGTRFVAKPKLSSGNVKLVSWRIADDDSYVLEFGAGYIRFIRLGGQVESSGSPLEVTTPYASNDVPGLKFVTANDVVYVFHPDHPSKTLKRTGLLTWTFTNIDFFPSVAGPTGVGATFTSGTLGSGETYNNYPEPYEYAVCANFPDGSQSLPSSIVSVNADLGHRKNYVTISWTAVSGASYYTVFKGHSGVLGFIAYVDAPGTSYRDSNVAPSYDTVPIRQFEGFGGSEYPRCGQFHRQRFVYAAPPSKPQNVWISRAGQFQDLTTSLPLQDDDAISFALVGKSSQTINHMLEVGEFFFFTDTSEWNLNTNDQALTPGTADPRPQTYYGADPNLEPLPVGNRILFVQNLSAVIRDMGYSFSSDRYDAEDLSRLSRHLFLGRQIVSWAYSEHPYNMVLTVMSDGTLAHMTYVRDHEIWGWSRSNTQGKFLATASVSEFTEHAIYFLTEREINGSTERFIERMEFPSADAISGAETYNNALHAWYLDCGLRYEDRSDGTSLDTSGASWTVTVVGHSFSVNDVVQIGLGTHVRKATITAISGDNLTLEPYFDGAELDSTATCDVWLCAKTITGLSHLEGETITALADGNVVTNLTVASGQVTLPWPSGVVTLGLGYTAVLETLDLDIQEAAGRYPIKGVNDIKIRLDRSRGILAGAKGAELTEIKPRVDEDYEDANRLLTGIFEVTAYANWDETTAVRVEAPYPLPANILNIVPDLAYSTG